MNLREALIMQAPSLELLRAAANEIARLDAQIDQLRANNAALSAQLDRALEHASGEPHIDGWPLYSGLPSTDS